MISQRSPRNLYILTEFICDHYISAGELCYLSGDLPKSLFQRFCIICLIEPFLRSVGTIRQICKELRTRRRCHSNGIKSLQPCDFPYLCYCVLPGCITASTSLSCCISIFVIIITGITVRQENNEFLRILSAVFQCLCSGAKSRLAVCSAIRLDAIYCTVHCCLFICPFL